MTPLATGMGPRHHRRTAGLEVLAGMGDLLLRPEPADEAHELPRAGIALGLVRLAVAIGGEPVLARDDIDPHPAPAQVIQRGGGGGELYRAPVAGADRNERLEPRGPRGQRRRDGEGVRPAPAGADQRALPAVLLHRQGLAGQCLQAVVVPGRGVATGAGRDVGRNVPEEFGLVRHLVHHGRCRSSTELAFMGGLRRSGGAASRRRRGSRSAAG